MAEPQDAHVCATAPDAAAAQDAARLAALDALCAALSAEQTALSATMAVLRAQGKHKSCQFREAMGQKLSNSLVISRLQSCGLWSEPAAKL